MQLLTSWPFWAVFHGVIALAGLCAAVYSRKPWTALLMCVGVVIGAVLAVVPLWLSMQAYEAETGFDAGNAGVFFCCTVPVFPLVGLYAGALAGSALDRRRG